MPLRHLAHDALETSNMSERELLVGCFDALQEINGNVRNHAAQLRYLWRAMAVMVTAVLTIVGLLLEHVL